MLLIERKQRVPCAIVQTYSSFRVIFYILVKKKKSNATAIVASYATRCLFPVDQCCNCHVHGMHIMLTSVALLHVENINIAFIVVWKLGEKEIKERYYHNRRRVIPKNTHTNKQITRFLIDPMENSTISLNQFLCHQTRSNMCKSKRKIRFLTIALLIK